MRKQPLKNKVDKRVLLNKREEEPVRDFFIKKIKIDLKDYTKQAVNMAVYSFLDDYYVELKTIVDKKDKGNSEKMFLLSFEAKEKNFLAEKRISSLQKDFLNELAYCSIREEVSKRNKRIREAMVAQFLLSAMSGNGIESVERNSSSLNGEGGEEGHQKELKENFLGIENDPLGIAISWEDKHKKDVKTNKK